MNYRKTGFCLAAALLLGSAIIAQQPTPVTPAVSQLLHPMFQDHAILR